MLMRQSCTVAVQTCSRGSHIFRQLLLRRRSLSSRHEVFPIIASSFELDSETASRNLDGNRALYEKVTQTREKLLGADLKITKTNRSMRKLTVRERLQLLRDSGTDVMELSTFAGLNMPYGDIYNASNIVAIATVCGEFCVVSASDWTFKGGTAYPITVKKQLRAQEISMQNRLPMIYLVDSGGAFLPLQAGVFPDKNHGGRTFRNQAVLSSMGIPQISVVLGPCTAGGAYIPTMSDEAVMVKGTGTLYLGGPPLVKAATGETIGPEELGGADVHCGISGCTDHWAGDEEEAFQITRRVVSSLNLPRNVDVNRTEPEAPLYPNNEETFSRLIPHSGFSDWPIMEIVGRLVDGSRFHPFKERFGPTLCAGFARINGHLIGLLASNGELTAAAALKGAHFIRLCTLRHIPLVFLQNTPSDAQFLSKTGNDGLTTKARSQMMSTLACSSVPKITVVLGGSYGPSSYAMCGRAMQPNFLFSWPHARTAVAKPEHLLQALTEQVEGIEHREVMQRLHMEESVHPTSNLVNDGVILPHETKQVIAQYLEVCLAYQQLPTQTEGHTLSALRM